MLDTIKKSYLNINDIQKIVNKDLIEVNNIIINEIGTEVPLINDLSKHILASGGKRIRPIITLLTSSLCNYEGKNHLALAACVEFIHTATLLHDDVIDESKMRRGVATANDIFGNKTSVLVGDFLFSRAFELMVANSPIKVLEILSKASTTIAQGEVLQLSTINDCNTSKDIYMKIIKNKTASLFSASSEISAVLSKKEIQIQRALKMYGEKLGVAFQLIDDALDYTGTQTLGKIVGDDFKEGKMTLPAIISISHSNDKEKIFWKKAIENLDQSDSDFNRAIELINKYNGIEKTIDMAKEYCIEAIQSLDIFPRSQTKLALESLAYLAINRKK